MRTTKLIYYLAAALLLPACSNESDDSALDSRVPLTVQGEIAGTQTRVALNEDGSGTFDSEDEIFVSKIDESSYDLMLPRSSIDNDYSYRIYKSDGRNFVPSANDTYYLGTDDTDDIKFVAVFPADDGVDQTNGKIPMDTGDQTDGLITDYLIATAAANVNNPNITFQFSHSLAKLELKFSTPIKSCTLSKLTTQGGAVITGGMYGIGSSTVSQFVKCHVVGNIAEALVLPQYIRSMTVDIETEEGKTYSTVLNYDSSVGIASNHLYTFSFTVKDKLELTSTTTIEGFESAETAESAAVSTLMGDITNPDDVTLFALVFSDGSFMNVRDENGKDDFSKVEKLSTEKRSQVVGIVIWLGDATAEDPILCRDYPRCNHGLIAATNYCEKDYYPIAWQSTESNVYKDFQKYGDYSPSKGYLSIVYSSNDEKIQGYNNTVVLKAYNEKNADNLVLPVEALKEYTYPAPLLTSGWFIPSLKEFDLMNKEKFDDGTPYVSTIYYEVGKTLISNSWTSMEVDGQNAYASLYCTQLKSDMVSVLPMCAF